jgi:hypothetical protein
MDKALPRNRRHLILTAAAFTIILIVAAGCEIQDPALPTFSTRLSVPIGSHEITVSELIEDQDYLYAGGDSVLTFQIDGDTTSVVLDLDLSADLEGQNIDAEIGLISLPASDPLIFGFLLEDIFPGAGSLPPGPVPVPAFDFDLESDPSIIEDIESAHIASGELRFVLRNNLPIPMSGTSAPEQISIDLIEPFSGAILTSAVFESAIAPGDTATAVADLAGVTLPSSVAIALVGGSAGGFAADGLAPEDGLEVSLELVDVTMDAATAVIDAQVFSDGGTIDLPNDLQVMTATLATGEISIDLGNDLPIDCLVVLEFPDIQLASGAPATLNIDLPAGGTNSAVMDLAQAVISADAGATLSELTWSITASSAGSEGTAVTIAATDRLNATLAPTTLTFAEVTGYIPEETFALDPTSEELDLPDELDGLQLTSATLTLEIFNGTGVGGTLDISLLGTSADGSSSTLAAVAQIAADDAKDMRTVVTLDETNSNIAEFLSTMPETVTLSGEMRIGGPDQIGTIRPGDSARLTWGLDAPLRLMITESQLDQAPIALDLDTDTREQLDEHLVQADVIAEVSNHFPFAVELFIQVGPDSTAAVNDPELVIGPLSVEAGSLDNVGGWVSQAVTSQLEIALSTNDIRAFTRPGAFTAVVAHIMGTNGEEIVVRIGDKLNIRGAISAEILISDEGAESS